MHIPTLRAFREGSDSQLLQFKRQMEKYSELFIHMLTIHFLGCSTLFQYFFLYIFFFSIFMIYLPLSFINKKIQDMSGIVILKMSTITFSATTCLSSLWTLTKNAITHLACSCLTSILISGSFYINFFFLMFIITQSVPSFQV